MIVRELRSEKTHSVCPDHFYGRIAPPPGMPLLGVVVDARTHEHECEWCALQQCLPADGVTRAVVEYARSQGKQVTAFRGGR